LLGEKKVRRKRGQEGIIEILRGFWCGKRKGGGLVVGLVV
jgi:hypothetical protein